jgi:hypothetical protein
MKVTLAILLVAAFLLYQAAGQPPQDQPNEGTNP